MKILSVHNYYQSRGGEDAVRESEVRLLRTAGHEVIKYSRHNDEIREDSFVRKISISWRTLWSEQDYRDLRDLVRQEVPDVAHLHNSFPLISPSAYYACADADVPVVQTLHNYRLLCPAAAFFRDGRVCESCLGRSVPWPGIVHGCYRDSRAATLAVSSMLTMHRALRTWKKKIDVYVALSEFARDKFIDGGLPPERIVVKNNFVYPDPGPKRGDGRYALYAGRLSEEKGVRDLLSAWSRLASSVPLMIAGEGPLHGEVASEIMRKELQKVDFLGHLPPPALFQKMHDARILVFPSVCFENFPLVIAEAFACGLPVLASRLGSMAQIVTDGRTGLHFAAGDASDLAAKVDWAWTHPEEMRAMGHAARAEYEAKYTAECNYQQLMSIYGRVISARRARVGRDCK